VPSDTIRICQGVPIPDGYVIIGYSTPLSCPHGAQYWKKLASYDASRGESLRLRSSTAPSTSAAPGTSLKGRRDALSSIAAEFQSAAGGHPVQRRSIASVVA
jgi:hypothetical protein